MLTQEQKRQQVTKHNLKRKRRREAIRREYNHTKNHDNRGRFIKGNLERLGAKLSKKTKDQIAEKLKGRTLPLVHKLSIGKGIKKMWERLKGRKSVNKPI